MLSAILPAAEGYQCLVANGKNQTIIAINILTIESFCCLVQLNVFQVLHQNHF
jgi:hypothetical protein